MTDGLGDVWRSALDANVRYYEAWGRVLNDYVRELGTALKGYSPNVRLPTITLPTVSARADTSAPAPVTGTGTASGPRPAEPAGPRPAVVLEAAPGAIAEGAVLVENHLAHPVSAAIHARIDGASDVPVAIAVEPELVDLAPGEAAVVRVSTTIPHVAAGGIELRGELLVPELVGTSVPLLIRGRVAAGTGFRRVGSGGRVLLVSGAPGGDAATSMLAGTMWWYASSVLEPARSLKRLGVAVVPPPSGDDLLPMPTPGLGARFSREWPTVRLLDVGSEHSHLVAEFEEMAQVYDAFVRPFSEPIFSEALAVLADLVPRDARALDAGCGAGRELKAVARLLDRGEVVGIDLAAEMVRQARAGCRAAGLDHTAFAQADVGQLPEEFEEAFDLVYCCLAHHHYPDPPKAARSIHRALRPGGIYAITDPGPEWFNATAAPMAKWSDPGWISFHTEQGFRDLLLGAGFARVRWQELLPGFALVLAQRAS